MKFTKFIFFKNTPLVDFQNTILFNNNEERDNFFLNGNHYQTLTSVLNKEYNFIRDRSEITLDINYFDMLGVNYGTFVSDFEPNTRYYFYVLNYKYVNDNAIKIQFVIDSIMTYCQGQVLNQLSNLKIDREHLSKNDYQTYLRYLKTNSDTLNVYTKEYTITKTKTFEDFDVIFQSSADLSKDFGTKNAPKMPTSHGIVFDSVLSPVNLYRISFENCRAFFELMSDYAWIGQNITKIMMIPKAFISPDSYQKVKMQSINFDELYEFIDGATSNVLEFTKLNYTMDQLKNALHLKKDEDYLLKPGYFTIELNTWDGQQINIDISLLDPNTGIKIKNLSVIGYANNVSLYLENYRASEEPDSDSIVDGGSFMNDHITFQTFDQIPVLVNSYNLQYAKSANQRSLENSKQLTNRIDNVFNGTDPKTRFMDAVSLTSNLSPSSLFGKFTDEYEYYRTQKAQLADLKLSTPLITDQTTDNALQVANNYYGVSLKISTVDDGELNKLRKYYGSMGFEMNLTNSHLSNVFSMSIANYVKFDGNYTIDNMDIGLLEQLKAQFANGVRLWHNDNSSNPMVKDLKENERIN